MRTQFAYVGAAAMVIAAAMFFGSGAATYFQGGQNDAPGQDAVEGAAPDDKPSVSAQPDTGGSIAGLIVGGVGRVGKVVSLALYWPGLLIWLGFPSWFATPIGWATQILALVGLAQMVAQRRLT